jgi:hypothetical protein
MEQKIIEYEKKTSIVHNYSKDEGMTIQWYKEIEQKTKE